MKITVQEMRAALGVLLDHLETTGQEAFESEAEFYWNIPSGQLYDAYSEPDSFSIGQLSDDLERIRRVASGQREPIGSDLVVVSVLLRLVGEMSVG